MTCFNNVSEIWDALEKGDFDVVVVEAGWRFYAELEGGRLCFVKRGVCVTEGAAAYPAAFSAALEEFSERLVALRANGARVVLVLDMPGAGLANPEELAFRRFYNRPLDGITSTDAFAPTEVLAQAGRRAGVEIVNPVDHVCAHGRCPAVTKQGQPLYRDTGHLRSSTMRTPAFNFLDPYVLGRGVAPKGATNAN